MPETTNPQPDPLAVARVTNQRLNYRAQQLESELAAYRRAVAQWEITDRKTYVPLRTLGAIAKAAGLAVPERWELHYERVERAEAELRRMADEAQQPEMPVHGESVAHLAGVDGEAPQDGAQAERRETVLHFLQTQQPDGTWVDSSSVIDDPEYALVRLEQRRERVPHAAHRIARHTTTVVVEPIEPAAVSQPVREA